MAGYKVGRVDWMGVDWMGVDWMGVDEPSLLIVRSNIFSFFPGTVVGGSVM